MLDEIFMWLKKLSLLKFNTKVAAAQLVETFRYFKREARNIGKGKTVSLRRDPFSPTDCHHEAVLWTEYAAKESHIS